MSKVMKTLAFVFLAGTVIFIISYQVTSVEILLSLAITFGTFAYHFIMRLLVGLVYNLVMRNRADYTKRWYQIHNFEKVIYEKLKVKKWKNKMPTYDSDIFNPKLHTWDEIAQAMCQAELVHETIVILSFVPIAAGIWFGAYPVFILTSIFAAMFDMMFVMMQRYNRQRIIRLVKR